MGVGLAWAGIRILVALAPATLPRTDGIGLDPVVLAFTAGAAVLAAALFGIVPALRAARPDLMLSLRASGRTSALGAGSLIRNVVVVAEVALSFVLLVGCGLMVRSFIELQRSKPGYNTANVLTFVVQNPRLPTAASRQAFKQLLRERLTAIPGVQSATAASSLPLDGVVQSLRWGRRPRRRSGGVTGGAAHRLPDTSGEEPLSGRSSPSPTISWRQRRSCDPLLTQWPFPTLAFGASDLVRGAPRPSCTMSGVVENRKAVRG